MHIGTPEILLIAAVILLLFGGKKIPELMRGLGKGVKSFKDGLSDVQDIRLGYPGILIQIFGGYALLRALR